MRFLRDIASGWGGEIVILVSGPLSMAIMISCLKPSALCKIVPSQERTASVHGCNSRQFPGPVPTEIGLVRLGLCKGVSLQPRRFSRAVLHLSFFDLFGILFSLVRLVPGFYCTCRTAQVSGMHTASLQIATAAWEQLCCRILHEILLVESYARY
eukprot:2213767-Rhodomonas_salina.1